MKKIVCLLLSLAMLLAALPACGSKPVETKLTNVFKQTVLELPEQYQNGENSSFYINQLVRAGETVYLLCNSWDGETGENENFLLPVNADGTFGDALDLGLEQTDNGGAYIQSVCAGDDGTVWALIQRYTNTEENGYQESNELLCLRNGESETIPLDALADRENGDYFYVQNMEATSDGVVLCSWNGVKLVTSDGEIHTFDLGSSEDISVNTMMQLNGKIYVSMWVNDMESSSNKLFELDMTNGKLGEEVEMSNSNMSYNMLTGPGYDFYYNDRSSIWGCTLGSDEKVEVLNFINSDINGSDVNQIIPLSADKFFAITYDRTDYSQICVILERVPDEELVPKKVITLAVLSMNYRMRTNVIDFNKTNGEYRVSVLDYSIYNTTDDYTVGATKLNNDIIAGKAPDVMLIDDTMNYDSLAAKGVFANLYELMDEDETFNREDYLENVFEAYEIDGELYSLAPAIYICTFAARSDMIDMERWNFTQFMDYVKANPDVTVFDYDFNRTNFLNNMLLYSRDSFVNAETGECSFDSEGFRALLEFTKSLPEDDFWANIDYSEVGQEFWQEYENRFVDGKVLLTAVRLYTPADSFKNLLYYTLKDEPNFIGFPSDEGNGAAIDAYQEFAIYSRSKMKDGAWAFLKSFISEEKQMPTLIEYEWGSYWNYPTSGVPLLKAALDKQMEIAMTPPEEEEDTIIGGAITMPAIASSSSIVVAETTAAAETTEEAVEETTEETSEAIDADGDGVIDSEVVADKEVADKEVVVETPITDVVYNDPYQTPLTQAQVDKLMSLITGATQVMREDTDLNAIITEEASYYFSGQKSLDETVKLIQDRAGRYINESR
ncbi:MAG: extracellular solute-binding protein [Clostridia bacterium]|nr:extracellular solute-binding protein [Clostridia bacterium]